MNSSVEEVLTFRTISSDQLKKLSRGDLLRYSNMCNNELRIIWNKLPKHLQCDPAFLVHQAADISKNETTDVNDGPTIFYKYDPIDVNDDPIPKHYICCFCKIRKLKIATQKRVYNLCGK